MKLLMVVLATLSMVACSSGGGGGTKNVPSQKHSNDDCPTNLAGSYKIEGDGFTSTKVVKFGKNSDGKYELIDGYGSGAVALIIDGESHNFTTKDDTGRDRVVNYAGACSQGVLYFNASSDGDSIKSSMFINNNGDLVQESSATLSGKSESHREVWTRQ